MVEANKHPILFVGAGPGDPELITVKGRKALEEADLVVYAGSLVSRDMLTWTRDDAECIDSAGLNLDEIVGLMVDSYEKGQKVVRLHTGDPSLYGAVREQFKALEEKGAPYQMIPGVTAAFAAASTLGLEYTLPEVCQTLILTRIAGRTPVPEEENLAGLASHKASLAVYLSAGKAAEVAEALGPAYGWNSPLAVVYRASWPDEKIIWTTPAGLADDMEKQGVNRQALILAGKPLAALESGADSPVSKLYDKNFSHGYRREKN